MNKQEIFFDELNYIKDDSLRKSLGKLIELLPDYFFMEPASSTGKYHPKYALGEGGLLRHTKAATRIGYELLGDLSIGKKYTSREKDLMLMALLLHDGFKKGLVEERYTRFDHPLIASKVIMDNYEKVGLSGEDATFISDAIKTHMGDYTTDYNGNEVLEKPQTKYQNFVHMCDYLASRKCLLVPFDSNNNIEM
ncbi:MAG TPA: hypothetical protein IAB59_02230 [Candidatus Onthousia faecipullorum]|uniref:HD domain-containing protein n=1 Tax=Candidatus Onthousia faecipullorum TaxID=2840887 RepID=A0A9D1GB41_9FIRM|nr:hypothetical protein [Candidatus Onthousia faecipullorum]